MSDRTMNPEQKGNEPDVIHTSEEPEQEPVRPIDRWMASFRRGMESRTVKSPPAETNRDRLRPLILGLLAAAVLVVTLLGIFSTPIGKRAQHVDRRTPNLGRPLSANPLMPESEGPARSVTPLLGADLSSPPDPTRGLITESDLARDRSRTSRDGSSVAASGFVSTPSLSRTVSQPPTPQAVAPSSPSGRYSIGQIEFSDIPGGKKETLAEVESRIASLEAQASGHKVQAVSRQISESLAKPSLIYVHTAVPEKAGERLSYTGLVPPALRRSFELPAGMRLIARLQSAITSAVVSPVVATVEYNYEKNGEILVPAGTKVLGKLEQANRSGHVAVKFDALEWPDGTTHKIDGSAQALDYGPIKGNVAGKKNIARFATRALTGVGVVASQVVGLRGGFNAPISNSALVRDRLANNLAQAGDQQMQQLAINSNIVVTVAANTRFYVVLQKASHLEGRDMMNHPTANSPLWMKAPPQGSVSLTRTELEELRELKQEFRRLMLLSGGHTAAPSPTPDLKPNSSQ